MTRSQATPASSQIITLTRMLEELQSEVNEQARLLGMSAERELALITKVELQQREIDRLRAQIEALRKGSG